MDDELGPLQRALIRCPCCGADVVLHIGLRVVMGWTRPTIDVAGALVWDEEGSAPTVKQPDEQSVQAHSHAASGSSSVLGASGVTSGATPRIGGSSGVVASRSPPKREE